MLFAIKSCVLGTRHCVSRRIIVEWTNECLHKTKVKGPFKEAHFPVRKANLTSCPRGRISYLPSIKIIINTFHF